MLLMIARWKLKETTSTLRQHDKCFLSYCYYLVITEGLHQKSFRGDLNQDAEEESFWKCEAGRDKGLRGLWEVSLQATGTLARKDLEKGGLFQEEGEREREGRCKCRWYSV